MKPGKPLTRKTPLVAKTPLARTVPLPRSALQANQPTYRPIVKAFSRKPPPIPRPVRDALKRRSEGLCEVMQPGCLGRGTDFSHRIRTGMGGRHGSAANAHHVLSNALAACRWCHAERLHARPTEAYLCGWMLRDGCDPLAERVLYRGAWRWLDDQGGVLVSPP